MHDTLPQTNQNNDINPPYPPQTMLLNENQE